MLQLTIDLAPRQEEIAAVTDYPTVIANSIQALMFVAALAVLGYLIWGAIDWLMSEGESGKLEAARKKMTHAVIGIGILMSTGAIFLIIQWVLGISILNGGGLRGRDASGISGSGPSNFGNPGGGSAVDINKTPTSGQQNPSNGVNIIPFNN